MSSGIDTSTLDAGCDEAIAAITYFRGKQWFGPKFDGTDSDGIDRLISACRVLLSEAVEKKTQIDSATGQGDAATTQGKDTSTLTQKDVISSLRKLVDMLKVKCSLAAQRMHDAEDAERLASAARLHYAIVTYDYSAAVEAYIKALETSDAKSHRVA